MKPKKHYAEQFTFPFATSEKPDLSVEGVEKRRIEVRREMVKKALDWSPE